MFTKIIENNPPTIIISTGNVLNVNKKAGQKPTEELLDCLTATLAEPIYEEDKQEVHRANDDLQEKMTEHERKNIKIGAKIFLNNNSVEYLNQAVTATKKILNVDCFDNIILAYHPIENTKSYSNGDLDNGIKEEGVLEWGGKSVEALNNLKRLWKELETFAKDKTVCQLGISDLDTDSLKELYLNSNIHPTIAQINLSACCVVPPALQEFCNKKDIQLLTHSDPEAILPENLLSDKLGLKGYEAIWTTRFQVHVKCRGLLTAKGFIVGAKRK